MPICEFAIVAWLTPDTDVAVYVSQNGWDTKVLQNMISNCKTVPVEEPPEKACAALKPSANRAKGDSCMYENMIPNEEVGYNYALRYLPGCVSLAPASTYDQLQYPKSLLQMLRTSNGPVEPSQLAMRRSTREILVGKSPPLERYGHSFVTFSGYEEYHSSLAQPGSQVLSRLAICSHRHSIAFAQHARNSPCTP